jgi:type II secretory pathway component PulM
MIKTLSNSEAMVRARERWQSLPSARQRVLIAAFACLALGLLWALVYEPIQASRAMNTARISTLQTSLAQMQRDAVTLKQLKTIAPVAEKNIKTNADSARLEALFGAGSKVTTLADGRFQIDSSNIQYADWLTKTDEALSRFNVNIAEINIKRASDNAEKIVNAALTLKAAR